MSRPRPGSTWIRELTRQLRPGYRLASTGRSKFFVLDPRGRKLRMVDGRPLVVPSTPSNYRSVIFTRKALDRAGALR
jgi:hypothetical protein